MINSRRRAQLLTLWLIAIWAVLPVHARAQLPLEGFVDVNGVRLQYLDWGGTGEALIFIPGLAANPYKFSDLAPAFTDRFRVIAYARRGSGGSEVAGPYDVITLTKDLRGLMDALGIGEANLAGASAAGDEITHMALLYPQRVRRLVYLDAAYDWADPDFQVAVKALPVGFFDPPPAALASLDAFRQHRKSIANASLDDMQRVEADLRQSIVIQPDGSVKPRSSRELVQAYYAALWSNKGHDYTKVRKPALAIYAERLYDADRTDAARARLIDSYEKNYWKPFQAKSIDRVRRELPGVEILRVAGAHGSFILTHREQVVATMRRFLGTAP